jgi:gas vesicle protein
MADNGNSASILVAFAVGAAVGAAVALLYARLRVRRHAASSRRRRARA